MKTLPVRLEWRWSLRSASDLGLEVEAMQVLADGGERGSDVADGCRQPFDVLHCLLACFLHILVEYSVEGRYGWSGIGSMECIL